VGETELEERKGLMERHGEVLILKLDELVGVYFTHIYEGENLSFLT
jgi:hypothetical protein